MSFCFKLLLWGALCGGRHLQALDTNYAHLEGFFRDRRQVDQPEASGEF